MLGVTLAIGDFMLILLTSVLWIGAGIAATAMLGLGAVGGLAIAARRLFRHLH